MRTLLVLDNWQGRDVAASERLCRLSGRALAIDIVLISSDLDACAFADIVGTQGGTGRERVGTLIREHLACRPPLEPNGNSTDTGTFSIAPPVAMSTSHLLDSADSLSSYSLIFYENQGDVAPARYRRIVAHLSSETGVPVVEIGYGWRGSDADEGVTAAVTLAIWPPRQPAEPLIDLLATGVAGTGPVILTAPTPEAAAVENDALADLHRTLTAALPNHVIGFGAADSPTLPLDARQPANTETMVETIIRPASRPLHRHWCRVSAPAEEAGRVVIHV